MNKKTVIFDLDGTLLNTLQDLTDSTNFALSQFNFLPKTIEQIRQYVGNGVSKLIERAIPNGLDNPHYEKCLNLFKAYYKENMFNKTEPYDGIISMLEKIKLLGIKTAVVSNKFDTAVKGLCEKYFNGLIDFCSGENDKEGILKKPAPDTILKVLNEFKIEPSQAVYVGDSEVDIATAKNAQIECISVLWGFKSKEFLLDNGAGILISEPNEIFKYL